jgi:hypothetical protein
MAFFIPFNMAVEINTLIELLPHLIVAVGFVIYVRVQIASLKIKVEYLDAALIQHKLETSELEKTLNKELKSIKEELKLNKQIAHETELRLTKELTKLTTLVEMLIPREAIKYKH